jgi:hypothetical protein
LTAAGRSTAAGQQVLSLPCHEDAAADQLLLPLQTAKTSGKVRER